MFGIVHGLASVATNKPGDVQISCQKGQFFFFVATNKAGNYTFICGTIVLLNDRLFQSFVGHFYSTGQQSQMIFLITNHWIAPGHKTLQQISQNK